MSIPKKATSIAGVIRYAHGEFWPMEEPLMDEATKENLECLGRAGYDYVIFNLSKGNGTEQSKLFNIYKLTK